MLYDLQQMLFVLLAGAKSSVHSGSFLLVRSRVARVLVKPSPFDRWLSKPMIELGSVEKRSL